MCENSQSSGLAWEQIGCGNKFMGSDKVHGLEQSFGCDATVQPTLIKMMPGGKENKLRSGEGPFKTPVRCPS